MTLAEYLAQPKITSVALARRLGVAHSTVLRWAEHRVPADRLAAVSDATGIPADELRPDLARAFDRPTPAPQAAA
jgi:DNA-binding transcriptional regulator YdaS (Cro superfamily)